MSLRKTVFETAFVPIANNYDCHFGRFLFILLLPGASESANLYTYSSFFVQKAKLLHTDHSIH